MKNPFRLVCLLWMLLSFSGIRALQAQQADTLVLDLEQCIAYAWENNLRLQQQKLGVDVARENLRQSQANRFPNLNASASHAYNFGRTIDPFTNDFATESVRSNNFSISSGLNLFSGFQLQNTIGQNRMELQAGVLDLEKSYNDIALLVASAYLQILFSSELVGIVDNQLEITRQQLERTRQLVQAGTLARGALLTIEAQLAGEEPQLVNARNQLDLAYLNLSQILFLSPEQQLFIVFPDLDEVPVMEPEPSPLQMYRIALGLQPDVKASEFRIASAERGVAIARGARSPSVRLSGSLGTGYSEASVEIFGEVPTGLNQMVVRDNGEILLFPIMDRQIRRKPFNDQLNDNLNRSVGLFVSIPLFNNYQVRSSVSRARINLDNARLQNQIVREQLFQTIQQAHADASASLKRYLASQTNVVALEEAFRYTQQRFNVGMVNSLEYNDAKNRLAAAQSELLQSRFEYLFRMKILDFYQGNPLNF